MKSRIIFYFISVVILFGCKKSNQKNEDSISVKDSLSLFFDYANADSLSYEVRHSYANKILKIIENQGNDSLNRVNYFKVANRYFNMNALEDYKSIAHIVLKKALIAKDTISEAKAYNYLGDYFSKQFISDSGYTYYSKAEKLYKVLKDEEQIPYALFNKAVLQVNEKDYVGCEKSLTESLKYLRKIDNPNLLYEVYNMLGIIYNELSEVDKSLEFHNKALELLDGNSISNPELTKASSLNNIGLVYQNSHNDLKAIEFFQRALKFNLREKSLSQYSFTLDNLAYSELKARKLGNLPGYFYKSLSISDSLKLIPSVITCKLHLSEYFLIKGDKAKSLVFADDAYTLSRKNKLPADVLLSLKQLSILVPSKVGEYSKEYIRINDSLQLAERKIRNKLGRIEYETDELEIEKANLVEQRKTLTYIALGIILIGVFIFVIRTQAAKNRELRLVQEQQAANEEIYRLMINQQDRVEETRQAEKKRIAQEIHDGVLGKLFGTRMHLGLLNDKDGKEAHVERVTYIDELKTLEQELREISHDLNSEKQAVANNFVQMVMNFIETQRTVCKATITIEIDNKIDWTTVDSLAKINLYRILQEAFQNVNKHAQAQNVSVAFAQHGSNIILTVSDDGVGFNYTKKKKGIGMLNMHSRITGSGGTMAVNTVPGNGTALEFFLPPKKQLVE